MNTAMRPMYECRANAPKLRTFIYQALPSKVLMTRAGLLRSRVLGNAHARFCSGGGAGDCLADHNDTKLQL